MNLRPTRRSPSTARRAPSVASAATKNAGNTGGRARPHDVQARVLDQCASTPKARRRPDRPGDADDLPRDARTVSSARGPRRSGRTTPRRPRRARLAPRRLRPGGGVRVVSADADAGAAGPNVATSQLPSANPRTRRSRSGSTTRRPTSTRTGWDWPRRGSAASVLRPATAEAAAAATTAAATPSQRSATGGAGPRRWPCAAPPPDRIRRRRAELRVAEPDEERVPTPGPCSKRTADRPPSFDASPRPSRPTCTTEPAGPRRA